MKRSTQGSPERLADALMSRIFRGEWAPGDYLPAERTLAVELGVDRTTLRMALKQLGRMNLISTRHGSGVVVQDYRQNAGLDVLAAMFSLPDLPLEGSFIVEALDFWLEMLSAMAAKAVMRMSLEEMRGVERFFDAALAARADRAVQVTALLDLQDRLAELSGSVFFRMLSNSTRTIRARISALLPDVADVPKQFDELRQQLRLAAAHRPTEDVARSRVSETLRTLTAGLRQRLLFDGAPSPRKTRARAKKR